MRLKKLELSGFKSFAKKTTLDFPSGITAVVGPNGSGKSNIVDSIKWVLAEQSIKSLRGKKGEDVIFHGSSARRSLPTARASLYLADNQEDSLDLSEVVIERQVNRRGENSYFLNERKVRLLDLASYLSSSAIGEGTFRVLSQGMSDKLVSMGAEEFRKFIEDAAGVGEFQDKKHRSLLKLRSCSENLEKVSVLLAEIGPRIKFLRLQKNKLDRRHAVEEELKGVATQLFSARHNSLVLRSKKNLQDKKVFEASLASLEKESASLKDALFSFDTKKGKGSVVKDLDKKINSLREEDYSLTSKSLSLKGRINIEKERARQNIPVGRDYLKKSLNNLLNVAKKGVEGGDSDSVLVSLVSAIRGLLGELVSGRKPDPSFAESLKNLEADLVLLNKQQDEVRVSLKSFIKERDGVQEDVSFDRQAMEQKEGLWREKEEELQGLRIRLNNFSLEEERFSLKQEQLANDIRNIGVIRLADVVSLGAVNIDEVSLEEKMWRLKKKLDQVGAIDTSVIEEYEGVKERYDFLEKESKDLKNTLESLEGVVVNLNKQIEGSYKETLFKVSEGFNSYFRLMFGGGKASLVSAEDGGEDGIGIDVSLPNKKIKNLSNLSGGERSLISIALLFSLVNIRRPPFLVLDEIDAALDEVNSQRFMLLLRKLATDTQFILITHNRETMRSADAVYGISIKDGVSHLLSIKLEGPQVDQKVLV